MISAQAASMAFTFRSANADLAVSMHTVRPATEANLDAYPASQTQSKAEIQTQTVLTHAQFAAAVHLLAPFALQATIGTSPSA